MEMQHGFASCKIIVLLNKWSGISLQGLKFTKRNNLRDEILHQRWIWNLLVAVLEYLTKCCLVKGYIKESRHENKERERTSTSAQIAANSQRWPNKHSSLQIPALHWFCNIQPSSSHTRIERRFNEQLRPPNKVRSNTMRICNKRQPFCRWNVYSGLVKALKTKRQTKLKNQLLHWFRLHQKRLRE